MEPMEWTSNGNKALWFHPGCIFLILTELFLSFTRNENIPKPFQDFPQKFFNIINFIMKFKTKQTKRKQCCFREDTVKMSKDNEFGVYITLCFPKRFENIYTFPRSGVQCIEMLYFSRYVHALEILCVMFHILRKALSDFGLKTKSVI